YLAGETICIETNAPESVHIGLTRSISAKGEYIFSLVNITSGPVRPLRSLQPVNDLRIKLKLEGKSLKGHKVLRSQGNCQVKNKSNEVELQLDQLQDFFSVHLIMAT
ncbi:MAG: hypothetical protein C0490_25220, partial [Marivirga sp.]|nr:hypothetical protein [Marivirga sp.]